MDLIDWVEDYLSGHGVTATRVHDATGEKAALYANVGPSVEGGVLFSGHTDVVPVDGQDWASDPFTVTERDGKLYGRGTADMKGFNAIALAAVPLAVAGDLKRPLQIALSYDEEVGCLGAPGMIDAMAAHLPPAACAIIGEPTTMQVVTSHKGSAGFSVHVKGFEVHSSIQHEGVSAVMEAAKIIEWMNRCNEENRAAAQGRESPFVPPWTTLHTGRINGGTAHNITAGDCHFDLDMRCIPTDDIEAWKRRMMDEVARVEAEMKAVRPEAGIEVTKAFQIPGLKPEADGAAEALARRLTGDNGTHVVSYGTEAGQFQERGYSAVVCGPGDIAQAHQADEFITLAQFEAGQAFAARVIEHLSQ